MSNTTIRNSMYETIDGLTKELAAINRKIYENPELNYEEIKAHDNITTLLRSQGIETTLHTYGLRTSFQAEYGSGGRLITYCAEYDALPGIGHACGHNLIATASIASFFGVVSALKESKLPGRVRLLGTPAEEGGGGKVKLIEAGAFEGVDAALMIHPTMPFPDGSSGVANPMCSAIVELTAQFKGRAAHAGGNPWLGINALDAATLAYTAVGMLRQQVKPGNEITIIIKTGESAVTGIIPDKASIEAGFRSDTIKEADFLKSRVKKCLEGAAIATGCEIEYDEEAPSYAELRPNKAISMQFAKAMADLGSHFTCDFDNPNKGSWGTDMGNVSHICPSFHGSFALPIRPGEAIHTPGFTRVTGTEEAFNLAIGVAKGMAMTGWTILADDGVAEQLRSDFELDKLQR